MLEQQFTRSMDSLGRLVIPIEVRRALALNPHENLAIHLTDDGFILRKQQERCIFCGAAGSLICMHGKKLCQTCADNIAELPIK